MIIYCSNSGRALNSKDNATIVDNDIWMLEIPEIELNMIKHPILHIEFVDADFNLDIQFPSKSRALAILRIDDGYDEHRQ